MKSKHSDELTDKDKAKIALVEAQFGKPIGELLQRKRNQTVSGFARQLGISVEQKRKWSRLILGQADVIQEEPCEDCGRRFRPTNCWHVLCDECSYNRCLQDCKYCGTEYAIVNPYETTWWERDGFCSQDCAVRWRSEKRQEDYSRWIASFKIQKESTPISAEEVSDLPWKEIRRRIIIRDEGRCRNTSCLETDNLRVHRIDGDAENLHPQNLITFCGRCDGYVTAYEVGISLFCE